MIRVRFLLAGLVLSLCLPGAALAQTDPTIDSVSATEAGISELITITGSDFVGPKPKVWLQQEGSTKKYALKVLSVSETGDEIVAEVRNGVAEELSLFVQNKGKGTTPVEAPTTLTLVPPELTAINPGTADVGTVVELVGDHLGTKKLKLTVGGKKAKATYTPPGGDGGSSGWTFKLPTSLANGLWPVSVASKLGETTLDEAIIATGSTKKIGKDSFQVDANGSSYSVPKKTLGVASVGGFIQVNAVAGKSPTRSVVLTIPFDPEVDMAPMTFTLLDFGTSIIYTEATLISLGPPPVVESDIWQGLAQPWSVTINSSSGGQVALTFEGTLTSTEMNPDITIEGSGVLTLP